MIGLCLGLLFPLVGCSGTAVQQAFSADPQASQWTSTQQLPADYPASLNYPNANLQGVLKTKADASQEPNWQGQVQQTRWGTPDNSQDVQKFYRQLFQQQGWQLTGQKLSQQQLIFLAERQGLKVRVTIPAAATLVPAQPNPESSTTRVPLLVFFIDYVSDPNSKPDPSTPSSTPSPQSQGSQGELTGTPETESADLQTYVQDLRQLGLLTTAGESTASTPSRVLSNPNQPVTRGTFARWLVETNNRLYRDRTAYQIRLAASSQQPTFQDVPKTHPDFAYIQGLAEAGFIPSPLSGDPNQKSFKPDQPLTRETLLLWKVPIDLRRILPSATADKVKEVWGFKDAQKISPTAMAAIFADHKNGDLANLRRLLGSALLLQPQKPVTQAEAAACLWFVGVAGEGYSAKDVLQAEQQTQGSS
ncbi:MAG: S-layer homology domain-containing protein [Acaryochloridaceae cyanobacterium SU_2_1]|nr:S-layer homology domain-containing protein [Acaryochloridaceae cyanobacterium SU_2_1]